MSVVHQSYAFMQNISAQTHAIQNFAAENGKGGFHSPQRKNKEVYIGTASPKRCGYPHYRLDVKKSFMAAIAASS